MKIDSPKYCSENICVRVTQEQLAWLIETSDNSEYSISAVVRQLIDNQIHTEAVLEREGEIAAQAREYAIDNETKCKDQMVDDECQ